jgi:hypothetical protein
MDCDSSEDTAEQQQPRPPWVKVQADDYTAIVSTTNIFAAHPASLLASLVDLELNQQLLDPCVRLDCSAEVAKVCFCKCCAVSVQCIPYGPCSGTKIIQVSACPQQWTCAMRGSLMETAGVALCIITAAVVAGAAGVSTGPS